MTFFFSFYIFLILSYVCVRISQFFLQVMQFGYTTAHTCLQSAEFDFLIGFLSRVSKLDYLPKLENYKLHASTYPIRKDFQQDVLPNICFEGAAYTSIIDDSFEESNTTQRRIFLELLENQTNAHPRPRNNLVFQIICESVFCKSNSSGCFFLGLACLG